MATIKPIEGRTVHQIQSGQVIVDLCSVVKELVENGLDAGATSIDVRFKNQGLDSIEVQDNGDGISTVNYETVALKHHTSKLSTYSDLTTLQTFGFRGEALSSLCALSHFSIITCIASDAPKGTKLEFEVSGKLKGTSIVAAQKGTTVSVENLFNNLPVRRRELERNIKREWSRVVAVLGQYACIQTGVKLTVTQQVGKGKKTTLFSTKGNQSTRENIVNVFGAKTLTALVPLDLNLEFVSTSGRRSTEEDGGKKGIHIAGHISRPAFGEGRQTPDRQMFFVNKRPCGLPQITKAFNEVYKAYNASQSPFIFANMELDTHLYDVNVSPDKRTILLHDQTRMLENLKTALTELFESQDYTIPISQLPSQKQPSYKQLTISHENNAGANDLHNPTEAIDDEAPEVGSTSSRRNESTDDEGQRKPPKSKHKFVVVPRDSISPDRDVAVFIPNSLTANSEERSYRLHHLQKITNRGADGLSMDKRRLIEKLRRDTEQVKVPSDAIPEESSSFGAASQVSATLYKAPIPVTDFNEQNEELQRLKDSAAQGLKETEPPIHTLSLSKPPAVPNMFSSISKIKQVPAEVATITIGDHIVTSTIGSPSTQKSKNVPYASRNMERSKMSGGPLSSFGISLSQRFTAPGATQQPESIEEDIESEIQDGGSSPQRLQSATQSEEGAEEDERTTESESSANVVGEDEEVESSLLNPKIDEDDEYIDEAESRAREEVKVQEMIQEAEESAAPPSHDTTVRAKTLLKGGTKRKDSTVNLVRSLNTNASGIGKQLRALEDALTAYRKSTAVPVQDEALDSDKAEQKLSLTISKTDFAKMKIIGQFNLGFILASRASEPEPEHGHPIGDDLFIIDQHASDEKYNFERLQATTIVQSQRLVYPKTLDLTALEEEILMENLSALETNGFVVTVDQTGEAPIGQRCQLVSLPLSRDTAFSITDLEELLALLSEQAPGPVPRPSKVRKMFAMRACRSSIMIGRTLTHQQMKNVVSHLGMLDKPWNCPHGRPTMRHLCGLAVWDELGWKEYGGQDDKVAGGTGWAAYVRQNRPDSKLS